MQEYRLGLIVRQDEAVSFVPTKRFNNAAKIRPRRNSFDSRKFYFYSIKNLFNQTKKMSIKNNSNYRHVLGGGRSQLITRRESSRVYEASTRIQLCDDADHFHRTNSNQTTATLIFGSRIQSLPLTMNDCCSTTF